ncbi:MAG: flagellar basal body P-ring protein FlgI [Opitutales bacterium]
MFTLRPDYCVLVCRRVFFLGLFFGILGLLPQVFGSSRIKDITTIKGERDNQLYGYGLVVGLAGTGDGTTSQMTLESVTNSLRRFGLEIDPNSIKPNNVAAVFVTADIGPFLKEGARLDVTVSSMGDADSLQGGVLLQTPLRGADGRVYAVAQGPLSLGGFSITERDNSVVKNHPTVGRIPEGAIIERGIPTELIANDMLELLLRQPDFMTSVRTAQAINRHFPGVATALDAHAIQIQLPAEWKDQPMAFIAQVSQIEVEPDTIARVILNERTGTIVATQPVRISQVAISHANLSVIVQSNQNVSQPNAFAPGNEGGEGAQVDPETGAILGPGGQTAVTTDTTIAVVEEEGEFTVLDEAPTINQLTSALNALGVTSRDMMAILQALKTAGALQAELVVQ